MGIVGVFENERSLDGFWGNRKIVGKYLHFPVIMGVLGDQFCANRLTGNGIDDHNSVSDRH